MSELDGFVVFETDDKLRLKLGGRTYIRFEKKTWSALGSPEYVNFFIDDKRNRIMVKIAEADYPNSMRVIDNGHCKVVSNAELHVRMKKMYGERATILGHLAGDGIAIFEEVRR